MIPTPGIYVGSVVHRRLAPKAHVLRYACYWLLVELPRNGRPDPAMPALFSFNGRTIFSVQNRDYAEGSGRDLTFQIGAHLSEAGVDIGADGAIFLLTMPRILGYVFNPLSIYFCYRADGALRALVYEVHNTFGQRHSYLMPVERPPAPGEPIRQQSAKRFYVSPFLQMDMTYDFTVTEPGDRLTVAVGGRNGDGPLILTSLTAHHRALTSANLLKVFFTHPLVAMKVIGAIHWEALRLWAKGIKLIKRPPPPATRVTVVRGGGPQDQCP